MPRPTGDRRGAAGEPRGGPLTARTTPAARTSSRTRHRPAGGGRAPGWAMAVGALCVSASAVLLDLAHTTPATASFHRCVLALPALVVLAGAERRREGPPPRGHHGLALAAGVLFAGDMLLWTQAIAEVGAGLSTVLVNVQVVLVPLIAWAIDREPVPGRFLGWLPLLLLGVVLTGGVLERGGATGTDPRRGTVHAVLAAVCYSGFLYLLRRGGHSGHVRQLYTVVVASAAVTSMLAGLAWYGFAVAPGWRVMGWLLAVAVSSQVVGWLLVATASPRLASHVGAVLLLLTPVGAVALGAVVLGERPTALQLAGCALILVSAYRASARGPGADRGARRSGAARRQDAPANAAPGDARAAGTGTTGTPDRHRPPGGDSGPGPPGAGSRRPPGGGPGPRP
ncbi:DMT family transporter [Streptomyces sp. NPDC018347]|uniref:DMT family transporter n=1 Tax=Streptomyces sp. NPDC018347 TaxID=3157193 RepID=UPI0033D52D61